jgi:phytoene dehydrogenase-like protein
VSHPRPRGPNDDCDAIVVGAGHNGLITAAYLARAGLSVVLVEARDAVGGTAASESFAGATVNICNCDHLTFRTTPVIDELRLADHGLRYENIDPPSHLMAWSDGTHWTARHDLDENLDSLGRVLPGEVAGYRDYAKAAMPVVQLILEAASLQPSRIGLTRLAVRRRLAGIPRLLAWSRRSAADVLRSYFTHDALTGTAAVFGPMVWGVSPELPGTGLGALGHAMRHVARVGRPVGGSGAMPEAVLAAYLAAGGKLVVGRQVTRIRCAGDAVRGVTLEDGTEYDAPVVVSACDPHRTFLEWLHDPPPAAQSTVERWRHIDVEAGYESKVDAILSAPPVMKAIGAPTGTTVTVAPSLAEIDRGFHEMRAGRVLDRPALLLNVPTVLDPTMAPAEHPDHHVLSLEVLYTPYGLQGGWPGSPEPQRWLELFASLCEPGVLDSVVAMRAMTPDVYERDFHLPLGHATSFAGGPLAIFRGKDPELTHYETAVTGLFLTGAATFPGAGVWGASGRNCAGVVLDVLKP